LEANNRHFKASEPPANSGERAHLGLALEHGLFLSPPLPYIRDMNEPKEQRRRSDVYDWIGYVLAAAILIPLGWWLKTTDPLGLNPFFASWFGR
jgi:hypothetical protein